MEKLEPGALGLRGAQHALDAREVGRLVVQVRGGDECDSPEPAQEVQDLAAALRAQRPSRMQQDPHQGVYVSRRRRS